MNLICLFKGHDWLPPMPVVTLPGTYEAWCRRGDRSIKGNWDWMEINGAWQHHRSSDWRFWPTLTALLKTWWRSHIVMSDEESAQHDRMDRNTDARESHRWSGWPGAWCLDCGAPDPLEECLAEHDAEWDCRKHVIRPCEERGSKRHDPYANYGR